MKALTIIGIVILVALVIGATVFMSVILHAITTSHCEGCPKKEICDKQIEEGRMSICEEEIFGNQNTASI